MMGMGSWELIIVLILSVGIVATVAATVIVGVVLARRGGRKKCPKCAEHIKTDAKVCRFCGEELL